MAPTKHVHAFAIIEFRQIRAAMLCIQHQTHKGVFSGRTAFRSVSIKNCLTCVRMRTFVHGLKAEELLKDELSLWRVYI